MNQESVYKDPCSLSNIEFFKASHLDWEINTDFSTNTLSCKAVLSFKCVKQTDANLVLDCSNLSVEEVKVDNIDTSFKILPECKPFGQPLEITLPSEKKICDAAFNISIQYKTSPKATAVQWLKPEQTLGKKYPYLFTQCQAIHARSLVPCQDSPGNKLTYKAQVTVPNDMVALMSAVKGEEIDSGNGKKICNFEQKTLMPTYLLALAIGALEFRQVGPRSKVWCEAEMISACEYEFAKVEDMLAAGESLMGPYVWGQYDLLILPPSFPYGGMENPCLTFATPTVVAGDRSLTSLVAHEITHSWTGNLVTNRSWEHFWLNEGFTRFLEGKIVGLLEGEKMRQFMAISGWSDLIDSIEVFGSTNKLTALVPELCGIDPDDAFSSVPYEKGYAFLYYIESLVGGPAVFNEFLKDYINQYKYKTVVTEEFKQYLLDYFKDKPNELNKIDWNAWLNTPGMPPVNVVDMYDTTLSSACKELCDRWISATPGDYDNFKEDDFLPFTTMQKIDFLTKLSQQTPLSLDATKKLADTYKLLTYNNSEIRFNFLRLCIRAKWVDVYNKVVEFLLEQGRMKFVRPLYRELYKNEETRDLAINTFQENRHIYHSITDNMVAKDLNVE